MRTRPGQRGSLPGSLVAALVAGAALSGAAAAGLGLLCGAAGDGPEISSAAAGRPASIDGQDSSRKGDPVEREIRSLETARKKLAARISRLRPAGTWVLIDTGANRIYLMENDRVVREAICSTGSGTRLEDPGSERHWVFNTPRGEFEIRNKKTDPVWIKPDWAFIEEGKPVPDSFRERVEPDMLGDYSMDLGDGYLIHGTLFKRSLGLSVTHGCVRVGDDDLEAIYRAVRIGTRVYIV